MSVNIKRTVYAAGLVLVLAAALFVGPSSSGYMLTDWGAGDVYHGADLTFEPLITGGGPSVAGADITGWDFRDTGGVYYFRMDLRAAPVAGNAAPEYSFQFDSVPGGDDNSVTGYVPAPLTGIDEMLVSHFSDAGGVWTAWHRHRTTGGAPSTNLIEDVNGVIQSGPPPVVSGTFFDSLENGGATLQWAVPHSELLGLNLEGGTWAVTHDIDDAFGGTFDISEARVNVVPEPASGLLFGLLGLLALRRRRS